MAAKASLMFFLCLVFLAHTLSVPRELKISDTGLQSEVLYKPELVPVFGLDKVLTRNKRHLIRSGGCSKGRVFYKRRCITHRRYKKLIEGDYDE